MDTDTPDLAATFARLAELTAETQQLRARLRVAPDGADVYVTRPDDVAEWPAESRVRAASVVTGDYDAWARARRDALRELRAGGWKLSQLAELAGVGQTQVSRLINADE